ncbi:MAG TPA: NUDIX domain-containing protein [Candidatus Saccharimonadales bacterium]|nr:NUDIX domain-containing protein [Candidatus Saccharimonadales bacterium]
MRTVVPKNAKTIPPQAKRVFAGQIFDVHQWPQKMFDGSTATFEMLKRPDTLIVLAIKNSKIIILEEEQPGHPPFFGVPGGRHDMPGETELIAAQRELREETGLLFKHWKLIDVRQPQFKIDWLVYAFVAWDLEKAGEPEVHPGEKITIKEVTFAEALELADNPQTRHIPKDLLIKAGSIEGLMELPEYQG